MKKKILIYTIPNAGHMNILKLMTRQYSKHYDFTIVVVDRKNTRPDLSGIKGKVFFLKNSNKFKNTQASAIFTRVAALLDECLSIAKSINPDLIIYDFPSIEGYFVGKILHIPYWCSIPGMMGPFTHTQFRTTNFSSKKNREGLKIIKDKYGIEINEQHIEVISNCFHIPGEINLLWSYRSVTPRNFMKGRIKARYVFVGYLKMGNSPKHKPTTETNIYFSLGTEVMDNIWVLQKDTRERIRKFIGDLNILWKDNQYNITFITQGKHVIPHYAKNWYVYKTVNQQKTLSKTDIFITHGGSNSFHESLLMKVPMVFIPFFGDQPLVSRKGQKLNIGINLVTNNVIEKQKSMSFINSQLVISLDNAVKKILVSPSYKKNISSINLTHTALGKLLHKQFS